MACTAVSSSAPAACAAASRRPSSASAPASHASRVFAARRAADHEPAPRRPRKSSCTATCSSVHRCGAGGAPAS
eukprot:4367156-Prymnesium_polylepis.4